MHFNINLTSLAIILWSGMLIISGSIWVLCAEIRKVHDLMDAHYREAPQPVPSTPTAAWKPGPAPRVARASVRRTTPAYSRRVVRIMAATTRDQGA